MKYTETDRYGNPLKEITAEEVIAELGSFPVEIIIAICAALIVAHEPRTWVEIKERLKENLRIGTNGLES